MVPHEQTTLLASDGLIAPLRIPEARHLNRQCVRRKNQGRYLSFLNGINTATSSGCVGSSALRRRNLQASPRELA